VNIAQQTMRHVRATVCVAKKWARVWDEVEYFSDRCRAAKRGPVAIADYNSVARTPARSQYLVN
jgi:hypothetical protein